MSGAEDAEVLRTIGEDPRHQRRQRRVTVVGGTLMAAVVVAALLGFTGDGVFSEAEATGADGRLVVSYERVVRNQGQTDVEITVPAPKSDREPIAVRINQSYVVTHQVQATTPEPTSIHLRGPDLVYEFPATSTGFVLRFDLRPSGGMGFRDAAVAVDDTAPVIFRQFVLP